MSTYRFAVLAAALVAAPSLRAQTVTKYYSYATTLGSSYGGEGYRSATARASRLGATGEAIASGAKGTLHASMATDPEGGNGCGWWENGCVWGGGATAVFRDVITVTPGKNGDPLTWDFTIDGHGDKGRKIGNGKWSANASYYFGTNEYAWLNDPTRVTLTNAPVNFSGEAELPGKTTFYFYMSIAVTAFNGATADFSHTMRFDWELPEGATYTSDSGIFMSEAAAPAATTTTPEPASWLLLGGGLLATAAATRRRRAILAAA